MKFWQSLALLTLAAGAISGPVPEAGSARMVPPAQPAVFAATAGSDFSVMTYNVHGLPWPFAAGRSGAFARIEERLARLRSAGAQPHVVVFQEAFTREAREIGAKSGYRYVIDGPDQYEAGPQARSPGDISFATASSFATGETLGKWMGSGLQLLSDYPVLSVQRTAFPAFACAGYDCLANKGALMVTLKVPGQKVPVTIVTTHMNSKKSSGAPELRSRFAYERQAEALERFIRDNHDPRTPIVFAGDFNASNMQRRQILAGDIGVASQPGMPTMLKSALQTVAAKVARWPDRLRSEVATVSDRGRDWQFFESGTAEAIVPHRIGIPFGREPDGSMLSDHMGMVISYRLKSG
ncbi:MAG: endonuclease/exonuclease/phosphatase family protein [Sphingomonadaceae bacterium]